MSSEFSDCPNMSRLKHEGLQDSDLQASLQANINQQFHSEVSALEMEAAQTKIPLRAMDFNDSQSDGFILGPIGETGDIKMTAVVAQSINNDWQKATNGDQAAAVSLQAFVDASALQNGKNGTEAEHSKMMTAMVLNQVDQPARGKLSQAIATNGPVSFK